MVLSLAHIVFLFIFQSLLSYLFYSKFHYLFMLNYPHLGATRSPSVSLQAGTNDIPLITPSSLSY